MFKRVFLIVADSLGCGTAPRSKEFGDEGANTIAHIAQSQGGITIPTLESLGYGNITDILGVKKQDNPKGYYGKLYIAGNMNNWQGTAYEMEYLGEGVYTITFKPNVPSGDLYLKIYDGLYWRINWSIKNGQLIMRDTEAFMVYNLKAKDTVTITINTITKEAKVSKN